MIHSILFGKQIKKVVITTKLFHTAHDFYGEQ